MTSKGLGVLSWRNCCRDLFPFYLFTFILHYCVSTHSVQIFGWFCWRCFHAVQHRKLFYCCFPRLSGTEANSDCLITHTLSLFCNSVVRVCYLWQLLCLFHFSWCLGWVSFRNKSLLLISILKNKFFLEITQGMVSLASLAPWDKLSAAVKHKNLLALLQSSRPVDTEWFACSSQPSHPSTRKGSRVGLAVPLSVSFL